MKCNGVVKLVLFAVLIWGMGSQALGERARVIVTTDGEADDRCSMVRFLLSANEFDIEGIVNSSSQFHWVGGEGWYAFHPVEWVSDYIGYYSNVYANLVLHDPAYPTPEYLLSQWKVGNINGVGEMAELTEGAIHIANVLLDDTDPRPVWVQAWGGCNTLARALKIIQDDHPERMSEVAAKIRLYLIWEQDETYQTYIRPNWEHYNIPTIIADQFDCMAYIWSKVLPNPPKNYFESGFMANIVTGHGALCDAYEDNGGVFRAEGDTPSFLHSIPTGLRSMESPGWGGWGGRFVNIRNNVWLDPKPDYTYTYPTGRWYIDNSWSKQLENRTDEYGIQIRTAYFKPVWRWMDDVQNDFAARADWCVQSYSNANHHPVVVLAHANNLEAAPGDAVILNALGTTDPDGDTLTYNWWQYAEADTYGGTIGIQNASAQQASFTVPQDVIQGDTIHIVCEVADNGSPPLTRYQRVVVTATSSGTAIPGNELIARYKLDGDGNDASTNNHHGVMAGSPSFATGHDGLALQFDGVDDYLQIPGNMLHLTDVTVATWVKWDGGASGQHLFDFGTGTNRYLFLTPSSSSGTLRFAIKNNGSEQIVESNPLVPGIWNHVAVTLEGDFASLYVNGERVGSSGAVTINPFDFQPDTAYVGRSQGAAEPFFAGAIDDFRIYNHALTPADLAILSGKSLPIDPAVLAHWRFEEGPAGGDVPGTSLWTRYRIGTRDLSGNGNHLCDYWDNGSSSVKFSSTVAPFDAGSNAFSGLGGGSSPSMATWSANCKPVGTDLEAAVLSSWTIEAIVKPSLIAGYNRGIVGRDGYIGGPAPLYFQIQKTGNLYCAYRDQAGVAHEVKDPGTLSINRWYYIAVVCNTVARTLTLYKADLTGGAISPTQVAQSTLSGSTDYDFGPWPDGSKQYWSVFRGYWNHNQVDRFQGSIDEVRISGAALDLGVDGLLSVGLTPPGIISTDPVPINMTFTNGFIRLTWPQDHKGWRLQYSANLLSNSWVDVEGSTETNFVANGAANSTLFYRMVYP